MEQPCFLIWSFSNTGIYLIGDNHFKDTDIIINGIVRKKQILKCDLIYLCLEFWGAECHRGQWLRLERHLFNLLWAPDTIINGHVREKIFLKCDLLANISLNVVLDAVIGHEGLRPSRSMTAPQNSNSDISANKPHGFFYNMAIYDCVCVREKIVPFYFPY